MHIYIYNVHSNLTISIPMVIITLSPHFSRWNMSPSWIRSARWDPGCFPRATLRQSNMAGWKMDNLSVIFLLKPLLIGDFPLPCLITRGWLSFAMLAGRVLWVWSNGDFHFCHSPSALLSVCLGHAPWEWGNPLELPLWYLQCQIRIPWSSRGSAPPVCTINVYHVFSSWYKGSIDPLRVQRNLKRYCPTPPDPNSKTWHRRKTRPA